MAASVLFKCLLRRAAGTEIDLFGKTYAFLPTDPKDLKAPHVCAIPSEDAKAIHRLLQIKEAYALVDPAAELPAKPKAEPGQTIGNEKPPAVEVKPIIISDGEKEIDLTQLQPDELRILAKETFGISVHHKWADATVIAKIIEKTRNEN